MADYRDQIEKLRTKIRETQSHIDELQAGRLTAEETRERINRWVDAQAKSVDAYTLAACAALETQSIGSITVNAHSDGVGATANLTPFLAWLDPDAMKARLIETLDANADELCSRTKDRASALKKAEADLAKLERHEESLIVQAESAGVVIERRDDVNPEIILEAS